ncbi:DivIVA domain-containing protein [Lactococcus termiticola]|uniref:Cell division protein DivIVA n=1 Tax=Lactococcus termiticola TaxID=2169526 RepID=A0A2R5HHX9_9LACT|nr:DivIVA domain-containing protein [Lactococcus termiticola]GBG97015.1 cell division protein DivIVA [Lactococcus termiticola]
MALSSLDIQNKTFDTKFRGYDKVEIDEFLDLVTRDYDEFAQTIKDQDRELKTLREQIKYYDDMRDTLNNSIVVAQDAADNLRSQAEAESGKIIDDAGVKGQNIIEGAKKEGGVILTQASADASRLIRDADDLRRKMRLYHQRMKQLIEAQLANVNSEEWTEVLNPSELMILNPEEKLQEIVDNAASTAAAQTEEPEAEAKAEEVVEAKPEEKTSEITSEAISEVTSEAKESKAEATETAEEASSEAKSESIDFGNTMEFNK